ncbi:MAG TPA: DUF3073 domain-containing protein [Mycobacteriales bacterium]|nr:DUF3073 domain-containing protein [Mycobacteriales bacterium]
MGRGRAKAKQTKVARQLKYSSGGTDLDRLQEELAAERAGASTYPPSSTNHSWAGDADEHDDESADQADDDDTDDDEPYAAYADDDEDEADADNASR